MISSLLRRWITHTPSLQLLRKSSSANRMMTTAASGRGGVRSPEPPSAPWLMLPPCIDGSGSMAYRFHRLADNDEFSCHNKLGGCGGSEDSLQLPLDINIIKDVDFAGSSHGWLALYNRRTSDLVLSNPITDRHMKLPALPQPLPAAFGGGAVVDRVILSSSPEQEGCLAFTTIGGRAALCSPRRSSGWTFFPGDREYDDLVYSSTHNRLFCVTRGGVVLEGWDTSDESPRLDWAIQDKREPYFCGDMKECCQWPTQCMLKRQAGQVKYLVCDEHSGGGGGLFLVVRHVNLLAGPHGAMVDTIAISQYGGRHYVKIPYKTFDFDVYKMDWERGEAIHMEDSLEGLAMFVGGNHSFAIQGAAELKVKPDSVYFTDEIRTVGTTRFAPTNYGGHDNGVFDYRGKDFSSCCPLYPIEFTEIRKVLPLPLWFTPTTAFKLI